MGLQRRTRQPRQLSPRPTRRRPESRQLRPPSRRPAVPERGRSRLVRQQRQTRSTRLRWLRLVARRLLLRLPRLPQRLPTRNLSRSRRLLMPSPLLTKGKMLPWSSVQLMGPSANQAANARRSTTRRAHTWPRTVSRAPLPPLGAADPKKCAALTAGAKGLFKAAISNKKSCPLLTSACAGKPVTFAARKAAMMSVFDWAAACKPFCYPGTETKTADGVVDSHGICLDADDIMQAKQQITSMPSYTKSGTGGRFPAGPKGDICKMAKMLVCGAAAGADEPLCK